MASRYSTLILLLCTLGFFIGTDGYACRCMSPSLPHAFCNAEYVMWGSVSRKIPSANPEVDLYRICVRKIFKEPSTIKLKRNTITLSTPSATGGCNITLEIGQEYALSGAVLDWATVQTSFCNYYSTWSNVDEVDKDQLLKGIYTCNA